MNGFTLVIRYWHPKWPQANAETLKLGAMSVTLVVLQAITCWGWWKEFEDQEAAHHLVRRTRALAIISIVNPSIAFILGYAAQTYLQLSKKDIRVFSLCLQTSPNEFYDR